MLSSRASGRRRHRHAHAARAVRGMRVVVVSSDKDLMQLVGDDVALYDTMKENYSPAECAEARRAANRERHLALVGDTSDNIKGVPASGQTAADLLAEFGSLDAARGPRFSQAPEAARDAFANLGSCAGTQADRPAGRSRSPVEPGRSSPPARSCRLRSLFRKPGSRFLAGGAQPVVARAADDPDQRNRRGRGRRASIAGEIAFISETSLDAVRRCRHLARVGRRRGLPFPSAPVPQPKRLALTTVSSSPVARGNPRLRRTTNTIGRPAPARHRRARPAAIR